MKIEGKTQVGKMSRPFGGVLWMIWDGAAFDAVAELMAAGSLPTLSQLSKGRVVPLAPLSPNCQTPPSLASLYTGAAITEHGVSGFRVPVPGPEASFVEARSGFDMPVRRPLLWQQAAAAGRWVGLSHIAWSVGTATDSSTAGLAVGAYHQVHAQPAVIELSDRDLQTSFQMGNFEVRVQEHEPGYVALAPATGHQVRVTPSLDLRLGSPPLRLGPGLSTRLGVIARPGAAVRLVHTGLWQVAATAGGQPIAAPNDAFEGRLAGEAYRSGRLGARATESGDGAAEQALLESARSQVASFTRSCELVLQAAEPDGLVIAYMPTIDEIQHLLFRCWAAGDMDQPSQRAREVIATAYRLADAQLARLRSLTSPECRIVICSDHGAGAVERQYHPNQTLAHAGLLAFNAKGGIEPSASQVAYHPASNGSVWVNDAERRGGRVALSERPGVIAAAERALKAARDPLTGRAPVQVAHVAESDRHLFGELMLRLTPGYDLAWEPGPGGREFGPAERGGTHITPTGESSLCGMLAVSGDDLALPASGLAIQDVYHAVRELLWY